MPRFRRIFTLLPLFRFVAGLVCRVAANVNRPYYRGRHPATLVADRSALPLKEA